MEDGHPTPLAWLVTLGVSSIRKPVQVELSNDVQGERSPSIRVTSNLLDVKKLLYG